MRPKRLLALVCGLWTLNIVTLAAVAVPRLRYTFYFDSLVLVAVMLALIALLREARQRT